MLKILIPARFISKIRIPALDEKIYLQTYEDNQDYEKKLIEEFWDIIYGEKMDKFNNTIFVDNEDSFLIALKYLEAKNSLERLKKRCDIMNNSVELQGCKILKTLRKLQRLKSKNVDQITLKIEKGVKVEAYIEYLTDGNYSEKETNRYTGTIDEKEIDIVVEYCESKNSAAIEIPPLRNRKEDIPYMVDHLLSLLHQKHKHLPVKFPDEQTMNALLSYDWPGNTEELINMIYKYASGQDIIGKLIETSVAKKDFSPSRMKNYIDNIVAKLEKQFIYNALEKAAWNRKKAATMIGVNYKTFCYKMKKYGIHRH
ncbi:MULTISPECIES: AAA-type ATPase lid domain-containing protein [Pseudothermotoga]|jgi:DNA-binding protein Fis|uniref:Transcriptional regulator, Fis family n=1 Tax=Pseudothermotoga lettingae (strain ATCC BAA-301 / DSM 14385 / NBRC 107922 / TMO) TaxID=416591 RepID=A8F532_PSELT|nr:MULTISPECIES: helix-turn-helix domain-containing protein [Pseudothermotoga]ABV33266.1 transcriptional regulator, Fis family [Pseudothermotoga lettingae TMO]KUK19966.1 MAG: Transcriptional regulator, Fis family [Pseudothermotoga lettingae]MDI3493912.1 hypothetical protein [Pseudothermotoga sp.]MDK2884562.1 hypothetical protein [Pseudothermotoga sp.]GLI49817.1 transcriptional regulator [Pseudothermotoga lettingae TMO]